MKILTNKHNPELHWSLDILFQQRMGHELFIPRGMEWYDQGYYKMHKHLLRKDPERWMAKRCLVDSFYGDLPEMAFRGCKDYPKVKTLTLDQFKEANIDLVVCTNRENEEPLYRLKGFNPKLKFIRQVGNRFDIVNSKLYPSCMFSDKESFEMSDCPNKILYHQEFPLDIFKYQPPMNTNNIYAFQHNLEDYEEAYDLWQEHERKFSEYDFKKFGRGDHSDYIWPKRKVAAKMREASFIWQIKEWEGYSHVIHNSFALGRPMILRRSDIIGKTFEPLCDETTCVFTDQIERIRDYNTVEKLNELSTIVYERFKEVVNFDQEFVKIVEFLGRAL